MIQYGVCVELDEVCLSVKCFCVSGATVCAEIQGVIDACVKLTGMPDLTLSFMVSSVLAQSLL